VVPQCRSTRLPGINLVRVSATVCPSALVLGWLVVGRKARHRFQRKYEGEQLDYAFRLRGSMCSDSIGPARCGRLYELPSVRDCNLDSRGCPNNRIFHLSKMQNESRNILSAVGRNVSETWRCSQDRLSPDIPSNRTSEVLLHFSGNATNRPLAEDGVSELLFGVARKLMKLRILNFGGNEHKEIKSAEGC